jgi:polyhydroxyalkanoate synthesis regulator phasin
MGGYRRSEPALSRPYEDSMGHSDERLRILQLVEEGKISPEEGIRLIQALDKTGEQQTQLALRPAQWLRLQISDMLSGKVRVNVRLPVTVLNTGMKIGARFSDEIGQTEMGQIMDAIADGLTGQVIDIYDDQGEKRIQVFLE